MVHMSQSFILAEPSKVPFRNDYLKSCVLMTETECLVLTWDYVIVVSLIDKTQKNISLP